MTIYRDMNYPPERTRSMLVERVKSITQGRIEASYPLWKQGNIRDTCIANNGPTAEWDLMVQFIDQNRMKSNEVEAQIAALEDADLYDFDVERAMTL